MIFQLVQKNLSILGISKIQPNRLFLVIGGLLEIAHITVRLEFLLNEANTFQLYTHSAFMLSVGMANLWLFTSLIIKREDIFKFIDGTEKLLNLFEESKFRFILFDRLAHFSICIFYFF